LVKDIRMIYRENYLDKRQIFGIQKMLLLIRY